MMGDVGATDQDRERLGTLVAGRRQALGLSISAAARAAGIDRATWTGVERGTRRTETYHYADVERVLQWEPGSVATVLAGGPAPQVSRPVVEPGSDLAAEVERIARLDLPATTRLLLVRTLLDLHAEAAAERAKNVAT